jgi:hypothetical protein
MKKFILKILSFGFLFFLLIIVWILIFENNNSIQEYLNNSYTNGYNLTLKKIKKSKNQKIIFVGGSNVGYGLNSERIEKEIGIESFNFGVHGGIGIKKPIDDISPYLNHNDIVIFSPEYSNFKLNNFEFERYNIEFIDFTFISITDFEQLRAYLTFIKSRSKSLITNYLKSFTTSQNTGYDIHWFNQNGDVIGHHDLENLPISNVFKNDPITKSDLNELKKYIVDNVSDSKWFIIPPVTHIDRFDLKSKVELNDKLEKIFGKNYGLSIENLTFNGDCFFDTQYHLNYECKEMRTNLVINFIQSLNLN